MSAPWDKLRQQPANPPMQPGVFYCVGSTLKVELHKHDATPGCDPTTYITIGGAGNHTFGVQAESARVLSGFFDALADQLEGK